MCHVEHMPSVNIRELRNTRQLKQWLRSGKKVELRDRNQIIGEIVPKNGRKKRQMAGL
jgi:antitoxin (DNA-binding transcriptional repressor) of toxin-antitoxin stability system